MDFRNIINKFPFARIAVIGDVMLDKYVYGSIERISPEAPIPIFKKGKTQDIYELGGAANVAANISSLGGKVFLFGYIGKDFVGEILLREARERKIQAYLFQILRQTTQKTRFIAQGHVPSFRFDEEEVKEEIKIPREIEEKIIIEISLINPDVIVAPDYNKGCLTESLFQKLKSSGYKILVDPKPQNMDNYFGAYLITPNLEEGIAMSNEKEVEKIGRKLQEKFKSNILLKKSEQGMSLFEGERRTDIPRQSRGVCYVSGAGDSAIAVIALGLAVGASLEEAANLASYAAGVVVGKAGTSIVSWNELEQALIFDRRKGKLKSFEELVEIRKDLLRKGKKIVWTNGIFELYHHGHVYFLEEAKKIGDFLFLGLNSDESVKRLKGREPYLKENERIGILSTSEFVDFITIFSESDSVKCLRILKPDVYVKGPKSEKEDYNIETINQEERKAVEEYGGKIVIIPVKGESTSGVVNRIKGETS